MVMRAAAALLIAIALAGCGYVGSPQPPTLGIPESPTGLAARQVGAQLLGEFQFSALTTDKVPLTQLDAALRIGGREIAIPIMPGEPAHFAIPSTEWAGQGVTIAVHLRGPKGRWSDWSNEITLAVEPPVATPQSASATLVKEGLTITWIPPTAAVIARREENGGDFVELARPEAPPFTDPAVELGKSYEYRIQSISGTALSEARLVAAAKFEDKFAPAVPKGLEAVAGFASFWGGLSGVSVGYYSGSGISFSSSGDGAVLFDATGTETTARATFGAATTGSSFYFDLAPNNVGIVSTVGTIGTHWCSTDSQECWHGE